MRILLAVVASMLVAVCAYAQTGPGGLSRNEGPPRPPPAHPVTEKDYNAALKRVPDSNAKFDPWGGIREEPSAKSKKKKN